MRPIIALCLLAVVSAGCASTPKVERRQSLPIEQVELIPADRRPDLTDVVKIAPSYGHWGLEGWLLYLQPRAASTPGLCDLPFRYVVAPGIRTAEPNGPDKVRSGMRWAILDRPLSGTAQDRACRNLKNPSLNVAWFAPDGEAQVAAGAAVLREFMSNAARDDRAFRAALICRPQSCARQRTQARKINASMIIGMVRFPASDNTDYATWQFRLDEQAAAEAGIEWLDVPLVGTPYLVTPETQGAGRRISLTRYPSLD